ncbi:MAG: hypothetical protein PUG33_02820 [Mollicutes bacterium]|nr:hypothetical protein [Mollicutes bacterium]
MINKNNLWFLTLFSLILILGVYYVTLPSDVLDKIKIKDKVEEPVVKEENPLVALRVSLEETRKTSKEKLEKELTKTEITTTEKNNIYEQLKYLNEIQSKEEKLEKKIKKQLNINCFTKIDNKDIEVICISKEQNKHLANNIMRLIQENDTNKLNITVKFQKK